MIYDCFTFFNELDILQLRLNELSSVVDRFVLVEARQTFTRQPKPLYYAENRARFKQFEDRIIHVVIDHFPIKRIQFSKVSFLGLIRRLLTFSGLPEVVAWDIEAYQRNQIMRGLRGCQPDDLIIISDVDEIPRPEVIENHKSASGLILFEMDSYYYYLNLRGLYPQDTADLSLTGKPYRWYGALMTRYGNLTTPQAFRKIARKSGRGYDSVTIMKNAGWHFTYMGGTQRIIEKIESFSHQEYNSGQYKDPEYIRQAMSQGRYLFDNEPIALHPVPLDESFPRYLLANQETFAKHLVQTA
jgi:beta-1,4-mannosyl-glycoprotein beta-1,4-N-acetylglucosaminyltransferase